jgi:hypothetical protein
MAWCCGRGSGASPSVDGSLGFTVTGVVSKIRIIHQGGPGTPLTLQDFLDLMVKFGWDPRFAASCGLRGNIPPSKHHTQPTMRLTHPGNIHVIN